MGGCRNPDFAIPDDFLGCQPSAIELLIRATIGTQCRAFQRDSGKQALVPRIGEDLSIHDDVGGAFRRAALWTCRSRSVRPQLNLARKQRLRAFGIHHKEDEVGRLTADLKSDADAFESVECRGSPLALVVLTAAAHQHSPSVAAADAKCTFLDG